MDFDFTADQVALREAAVGLLTDQSPLPRVREVADAGGFDAALWDAMTDQGWLGVSAPASGGGLGLGMVESAILLEQAGAHLTPVPLLQQLLALRALGDTGWAAQLIAGERIAAVTRLPLRIDGDGRVSGTTEPAVAGALADVLVAPADSGDLVAVDLSGVGRTAEPTMDRTRPLARIRLEHAPAEVVGGPVEAQSHLDAGATFHSAELLGAAQAAMDMAVEYAKVREQFGRPIGSFQAVKHRCADMLVDVEGMRSAVYHAAWAVGAATPDAGLAAATAKIWCSDAGLRVAESALQVHGGIGFTWESDVHLYLKRIQLDAVAFGTAREHRTRLAVLLRERVARGKPVL